MLRFFSSRCFFSLQAKSDIVTLLLSRRWTTIEAFEILEGHTKTIVTIVVLAAVLEGCQERLCHGTN